MIALKVAGVLYLGTILVAVLALLLEMLVERVTGMCVIDCVAYVLTADSLERAWLRPCAPDPVAREPQP